MFHSKEEVLQDFVNCNSIGGCETELMQSIEVNDVKIDLVPNDYGYFQAGNVFSYYVTFPAEPKDKSDKFISNVKEKIDDIPFLKDCVHLNKEDKEYMLTINRKTTNNHEYTTFCFVQTKDDKLIIYYWSLRFIDYKDKVRNL